MNSSSAGDYKMVSRLSITLVLTIIAVVGCGGGGGGGGGSGGSSSPPDFTFPTVTAMSPGEDSFEIPTNTKLTATLSEAMVATVMNTDNFRLSHENDAIAGTVTYDTTNNIAVFTPTSGLVPNTRYTATVVTGIRDLSGNPLNSDFAWCFTTAAGGDSSAPSVTAFIPDNAAADVAINRKLSVTFSEEMDVSTLTPANFKVVGPGATSVPGSVTYINRTAVFKPSQRLAPNVTYTATVFANVMDLAGNTLPADSLWSFTTAASADGTAPTVLTTSPAASESGVAITRTINASFNEPMDPTTITTANFLVSAGGNPVVGTVAFDANSNTAIFTRINHRTTPVISHSTPVSNLEPNTTYTATLTTGAKDMAGNALTTSKTWSFTTAP